MTDQILTQVLVSFVIYMRGTTGEERVTGGGTEDNFISFELITLNHWQKSFDYPEYHPNIYFMHSIERRCSIEEKKIECINQSECYNLHFTCTMYSDSCPACKGNI